MENKRGVLFLLLSGGFGHYIVREWSWCEVLVRVIGCDDM